MLKKEGEDLFPVVFKLCFYNDLKHCISNMPLDEIRVLNEEELTELLESTELPIEKVNILVNNILLKHVMAMKDVEDETK